ncbi:very-short-patch-repair endonuclease [Sphingomonas kyeonggiensis]|nr:very-short-patch-repair endonuclease [Sphingomonas kyeonggiensis]
MAMQGPVRRKTNPYAARLRKEATEAESRLWAHLRNRQLGGFKFRFQASIGPYSVDFLCTETALVVEVDGSQHNEDVDRVRTRFIEAEGHRVLRFWNNEVFENLDGVLLTIKAACEARTWREVEE